MGERKRLMTRDKGASALKEKRRRNLEYGEWSPSTGQRDSDVAESHEDLSPALAAISLLMKLLAPT